MPTLHWLTRDEDLHTSSTQKPFAVYSLQFPNRQPLADYTSFFSGVRILRHTRLGGVGDCAVLLFAHTPPAWGNEHGATVGWLSGP